jgi:hypothetical protein
MDLHYILDYEGEEEVRGKLGWRQEGELYLDIY